jgi:hypothetical protein
VEVGDFDCAVFLDSGPGANQGWAAGHRPNWCRAFPSVRLALVEGSHSKRVRAAKSHLGLLEMLLGRSKDCIVWSKNRAR